MSESRWFVHLAVLALLLLPHGARAQDLAETSVAPPGAVLEPPTVDWDLAGFDVELGPTDGLVVRDGDGERVLHAGGVVVGDVVIYDDRNQRDSGARIDRAVLRFEGSLWQLDWRVAPDLKGIDTRGGFDEAWIAWAMPERFVRVSAGLMEVPLSIEHTIPEEELAFAGYAFPPYLAARTDLVLRVDGEVLDGLFYYDLSISAGEGFTRFGERVTGSQFNARTVIYPFRPLDVTVEGLGYTVPLVSGIYFSLGYSYTDDFEGPLEVGHPFRNKLFKVDRFEASDAEFIHLGYGADLGPFALFHEFVFGGYSDVELPGGGEETLDDQVTAWALSGSWMITGEHYDSRPYGLRTGRLRTAPRGPLFWGKDRSGPGAFELAVRYSNGDIDRDFFLLGFTDFTTSSQEFRTFSAALNWYPIENLRATFQVVRTIADQFPAAFDSHGRDTSYLFRVQYSF